MSRIALGSALILLGCATSKPAPEGLQIGEPVQALDSEPLAAVYAAPADHFDRTLLVEATVTDVCQSMGCWMQIEDGGHTAMVRWEEGCGGKYAFPKDAAGERVLVQGSFYEKQIDPADIEHLESEAKGEIEIPEKGYELNASAVVLLERKS